MITYLIDTNVLSELSKARPNPQVVSFLDAVPHENFFVSVITLGEIEYGIKRLEDKTKKKRLSAWYEKTVSWLGGNVLSIDKEVMSAWAGICAKAGRRLPFLDSLIAATTIRHGLTLASRNEEDFSSIEGLLIVNPWGE